MDTNKSFSLSSKNRMVNSVDPDKTAVNKPSYLDLYCLQRYLNWSAEVKY